jgi:hypothetical protein
VYELPLPVPAAAIEELLEWQATPEVEDVAARRLEVYGNAGGELFGTVGGSPGARRLGRLGGPLQTEGAWFGASPRRRPAAAASPLTPSAPSSSSFPPPPAAPRTSGATWTRPPSTVTRPGA